MDCQATPDVRRLNRPLSLAERCERLASNHQPEWLVEQLILRNETMILGAPEKSFKTRLAIDIAVALAGGVSVFGSFKATQAVPVLGYFLEDRNEHRFTQDMLLATEAYGVDRSTLPLYTSHQFDIERVAEHIQTAQAQLLILDCISAAFDIEHTSQMDFYRQLRPLEQVCDANQCQLMLVHHCHRGKRTGLQSLRGAGAGAWARQWIIISPGKYKNGKINLKIECGGSAWNGATFGAAIDQAPAASGRPTQWSIRTDLENSTVDAAEPAQLNQPPHQMTKCNDAQAGKIYQWLSANPGVHTKRAIAKGSHTRPQAVSEFLQSDTSVIRDDRKFGIKQLKPQVFPEGSGSVFSADFFDNVASIPAHGKSSPCI